jgi:aldose 1-epimerase
MNFTTFNIVEDGFNKFVLKEMQSNTSVEIIPSCGAVLHAFNVVQNSEMLNVIDNYDSENDFKENVTSKGFKSCKLSPFACRLKDSTYWFEGNKYTINKFFLGKNGHHGLLYDCVFKLIEQGSNEEMAFATMKYEYRVTDKGFPFAYDCLVTYKLEKDNKLSLITKIVNRGEKSMPVQDGWHPYFTFGGNVDDLELQFKSKSRVEFDHELLPTRKLMNYDEFISLRKIGATDFDHCFLLNAEEKQPYCILKDVDKKIQLEIYPEDSYPYLQLYIPSHRKSIAIENLSAAPDAFNNRMGLVILDPDENKIFTTTYKITPLN